MLQLPNVPLALSPPQTPPPSQPDDEDDDSDDTLHLDQFPLGVLVKIFDCLLVESILNCRLACCIFNTAIIESALLDTRSCFVFDGRREDTSATTKCSEYMETSETKNYLWSHMKLRRVNARQFTWIFDQIDASPAIASTISTLELLNSTLNWTTILQFLLECGNISTFIDRQEQYNWDYATFNGGIEENETILDTQGWLNLRNKEKLDNLARLRVVRIHRSQLTECTTYLKMFALKCSHLKELDVTTDQNFAPQRATLFYTHLVNLLQKSGGHLRILRCPYKIMTPVYDFRTTDEHRLFREFLTFVAENRWAETLHLPVLKELSIQYGIIPMEGQELTQKLAPFIQSLSQLRHLYLGTIQLDSGLEETLKDFLKQCGKPVQVHFGIVMSDATGIPNINTFRVENVLSSLSIQTFRDMTKDIKEIIPMFGLEEFPQLIDFQYFSKNHSFRNFNVDLLTQSFANVTHLNLVDQNARLETRHSCEALATIEDEDFQLIIRRLRSLVSMQLIGNMTFLTDVGLTGVSHEGCRRMLIEGDFKAEPEEEVGVPVSRMKNLKSLVLRGLGIKVTDVTAFLAFCEMPALRKLHLHGCHQITPVARSFLSERYNISRGCEMQV